MSKTEVSFFVNENDSEVVQRLFTVFSELHKASTLLLIFNITYLYCFSNLKVSFVYEVSSFTSEAMNYV